MITRKGTTKAKKKVVIQGQDHQEGDNQDQKKGAGLRKQSLGKGWRKPRRGQ
jgi:hypothetical protein